MSFNIRVLVFENGERYPILLRDGMPEFYPTLYVTKEVRKIGHTKETIKNVLQDIKQMLIWEQDHGISIEDRFREGGVLTVDEVQSLVDFLGYSTKTAEMLRSGVKVLQNAYEYIGVESLKRRVATVAKYAGFLYRNVSSHGDRFKDAKEVEEVIKSEAPKIKEYLKQRKDKSISKEQEDHLFRAILPDSDDNPWEEGNPSVRLRNLIMFHLLYETGMRRGELLGLRVPDIDFNENTVAIIRRHDDPSDPRNDQPLQKTRERVIPLSEGLMLHIYDYIVNHRNKNKLARKHDVLLVGHGRKFKDQGSPLGKSSVDAIFQKLIEKHPILKGLHPHKLRHHANYNLSLLIDANTEGMSIADKQAFDQQIRSEMMGWSPTGKQQENYNRRYNKQKADEALRKRDSKLTSNGALEAYKNNQEKDQ